MATHVVIVGGDHVGDSLWTIARGFERAGCAVRHIFTHVYEGTDRNPNPALIPQALAATDGAALLFWWQAKFATRDVVTAIRSARPDLPLVGWSIDDPHVLDQNPEGQILFDHMATCCPGSLHWYSRHGVPAFHLWTPCDRDLHGTAQPNPDEACDIAFASTNTYPKQRFPEHINSRVLMVLSVADLGTVRLYGPWVGHEYAWSSPQWGFAEAQGHLCHGPRTHTEMPGVYAAARINLSSTVRPDGYQYVNRRVVECMASGGFVLTDRVKGVDELLEEGIDCAFYGSLDELRTKVRYYLAHEDERAAIAETGRKRAFELFDNETAARRVLEVCGL